MSARIKSHNKKLIIIKISYVINDYRIRIRIANIRCNSPYRLPYYQIKKKKRKCLAHYQRNHYRTFPPCDGLDKRCRQILVQDLCTSLCASLFLGKREYMVHIVTIATMPHQQEKELKIIKFNMKVM